MDWDEASIKKQPQLKDLSPLGVAELTAYIEGLKAEITRAEAEIAKRESHKSGAEAFFRKGG